MIAGPFRIGLMAFVIRADDAGRISWITPLNERGFPSLSDRVKAAVFATEAEAQAMIDKLADSFGRIGVRLSIEPA
ncbi:MAG TPA: hypothetical protein VFG04_23605 [Planctomycetaceae bacterium]|jgi:hypothetical protein|nr:hypothetical protein [Planctomycetaceae bacterium]